MPQWRLRLDVPFSFAVELGVVKAQHCADFRPQSNSFVNTWRDPVQGWVMLKPSHLSRSYGDTFQVLANWRAANAFWQDSKRSADGVNMLAQIKPADNDFPNIQINIQSAIIAIEASLALFDNLLWAMESKFTLVEDEGFCWHYNSITDQMLRKNNWFAIAWDDIYIHFSHQGIVRVFQFNDRGDLLNGGFAQVDEFEICSPGELLGRDGYFCFLPVAGAGLLLTHSRSPQKGGLFSSNADKGGTRCHLIKWPTRSIGGVDRLFDSSMMRLALNPYQQNVLGFQQLRYPTAGTYTDALMDPGYQPSVAPNFCNALAHNNGQPGCSAQFLKPDLSGPWTAGVDKQARVQLSLSSSDGIHTPVVFGWAGGWNPVFATRATTPVIVAWSSPNGEPDRLQKLEFTEDEMGGFEGKATMLLQSAAAVAIAERGDATFVLDRSDDGGRSWLEHNGGLAKEWELDGQVDITGGNAWYYLASCKLLDLQERLRETHCLTETAFDNITPGDAVDAVLINAGFAAINPLPPETTAFKCIPKQQNTEHAFRLCPREGDSGEKLIASLLLYLKTQLIEWRARFDWATFGWLLEKRPRDSSPGATWSLYPFSDRAHENAGERKWRYCSIKLRPSPPEANALITEGRLIANDHNGERITAYASNEASLYDPTSPDYLGRMVIAKAIYDPVGDQETVNLMARREYDAIAHHRMQADECGIDNWQPALVPNTRVQVYKSDGFTVVVDGWIKKRTVTIEQSDAVTGDGIEKMILKLDDVWDSEMEAK